MPELSRFFGIVIAMHYSDHAPAHVHARYGAREARMDIGTGEILSGTIPAGAQRLVAEWLALHRNELLQNWQRAPNRQPLRQIAPLE